MQTTTGTRLKPDAVDDLKKSGLSESTIDAASLADGSGDSRTHSHYSIPYHNFNGTLLTPSYYRIKLIPSNLATGQKYKQAKNSQNRIYIPPINKIRPDLYPTPEAAESAWFCPANDLFITEGEKKALAGAQVGLLCLGLGGIDNWRSGRIGLGEIEAQAEDSDGEKTIKTSALQHLVSDADVDNTVAPELRELIQRNALTDRKVWLIFDAESGNSNSNSALNVQRAMWDLAEYLENHGAVVQQLAFPSQPQTVGGGKIGLDDYLAAGGKIEDLTPQPVVPSDIKVYVNANLNSTKRGKSKRQTLNQVAKAVTNALDLKGQRFEDVDTKELLYWSNEEKTLYGLNNHQTSNGAVTQLRSSGLGRLLTVRYGVKTTDGPATQTIFDEFASRSGIKRVKTRCGFTNDPEANDGKGAALLQVDNKHFLYVDANGIYFAENGEGDYFFKQQDHNHSSDEDVVALDRLQSLSNRKLEIDDPYEGKWLETLKRVNTRRLFGCTQSETHLIIACLFYLSPAMFRWKGLQLPLELTLGEPGSGKSTLYNLRRNIITGDSSLDNQPLSQKDWYAQITASNNGGMWICDNMGDLPDGFDKAFSDELARLITDPKPRVKLRTLYTTHDLTEAPVNCCFAITAVRSPLFRPDILERSLIIQMDTIPSGKRDGGWLGRHSRMDWLEDYALILQRFLSRVELGWDEEYLSQWRLIHLEQAMIQMAYAISPTLGPLMNSIVEAKKLSRIVEHQKQENNPVLECITAFLTEKGDAYLKRKVSRQAVDKFEEIPHGALTEDDLTFTFGIKDLVRWASFDAGERFGHVKLFNGSMQQVNKWLQSNQSTLREGYEMTFTYRNNILHGQVPARRIVELVRARQAAQEMEDTVDVDTHALV